jgi:hypothetical protein
VRLPNPIDSYLQKVQACGADLVRPLWVAFKGTTQEVIDFYAKSGSKPIPGVPKFDPRRVVDGQRMMQFLKPLPPTSEGKTFVLKSKVIGVYDKGKAGSVLETERLIVDRDTGEVCPTPSNRAERLAERQGEKGYGVLTLGQGVHPERWLYIYDGPGELGWTQGTWFCQFSAAQRQEGRCRG